MDINDKSLLVTQSNKLVESRYSLTLGEQRLIFAVASMIHPDDVDFFTYEISLNDLSKLLKQDRSNIYRKIDDITDTLMKRVLVIPEQDVDLKIGWVSSCTFDKKTSTIGFRFDPGLKPYLLQLKDNFTKSNLTILTQFQSIYTIRIYNLLIQYRNFPFRIFDVEELKQILGIPKDKYSQFKYFRQWVLNKAKKEMEKKDKRGFHLCNLSFDLETIKEGKKIVKLKFVLKWLPYQEKLPSFPVTPDPSSDLLESLVFYGIDCDLAEKHIKELGQDKVKQTLEHYVAQLEAGKVKNKGGGLLATFLKKGVTGNNQFQQAQKDKMVEQNKISQLQDEEKQAVAKQKESELSKLEETYLKLSSQQRNEIDEIYKDSLNNKILVEAFVSNGALSPINRVAFLDFVKPQLISL